MVMKVCGGVALVPRGARMSRDLVDIRSRLLAILYNKVRRATFLRTSRLGQPRWLIISVGPVQLSPCLNLPHTQRAARRWTISTRWVCFFVWGSQTALQYSTWGRSRAKYAVDLMALEDTRTFHLSTAMVELALQFVCPICIAVLQFVCPIWGCSILSGQGTWHHRQSSVYVRVACSHAGWCFWGVCWWPAVTGTGPDCSPSTTTTWVRSTSQSWIQLFIYLWYHSPGAWWGDACGLLCQRPYWNPWLGHRSDGQRTCSQQGPWQTPQAASTGETFAWRQSLGTDPVWKNLLKVTQYWG